MLKRFAIAFGTVLVLALGVLLVAPSFIDWTNYRETFESQLANASGRAVTIDGDVSLTLLPRPAFQVDGVRIANLSGATNPEFIRAEQVAVNLAFGPLLTGRLQFTSINIIEPIINAEVMEDGQKTWMFVPANSVPRSEGNGPANGARFDLGIDILSLVDGIIHYHDAQSGIEYSITDLNAELTVESTSGPFNIAGDAVVFGLPWTIDASIGALRGDRPSALIVDLANADSGLDVDLSGSLTVGESGPTLSGRLALASGNSVDTLHKFGLISDDQSMPQELHQAFQIEARIETDATSIISDSIDFKIGSTTGKGAGQFSWLDEPRFTFDLSVARLDLGLWQLSEVESPNRFAGVPTFFGSRTAKAQSAEQNFVLPSGLTGVLNIGINLIEWRGQVMRNAHLSASLVDAELTVADAGLNLPGSSSLQFSGFVKSENGSTTFDFTSEATSRDLRSMLGWLGVAPPPGLVPPSRLNSLSVTAEIRGDPTRVVFENLDVKLDTMRLGGTVVIKPGTPLKVKSDLSVSTLDLDSYLPALRDRFALTGSEPQFGDSEPDRSRTEGDVLSTIPLTAVDADITVSVGVLTAGGNTFRGIFVDASTQNGVLNVEKASFDDFVGARFSLSGHLHSAAAIPRAQDVHLSFITDDFSSVERALGFELPRLGIFQGPVALEGDLSGTIESNNVNFTANLGALKVEVSGSVNTLTTTPTFNLSTALTHDRFRLLMMSLGAVVPETAQAIGPVQLRGQVAGTPASFQISDIQAQAGDNALSGLIVYDATAERPQLTGSIAIETLNFDQLFPPDPTEQLARSSRGRSNRTGSSVAARWSTGLIDLSALSTIDVNLTITADHLSAFGLEFEQLNAPVSLSSGTLAVTQWQGTLYGGPANGDLTLISGPPIEIQTRMEVIGAAIDRVGGSLAGARQATGKITFQGEFAASGVSQRELVSSLSGRGMITATEIDANTAGQGVAFTALLAPVRAMSQLGGVFTGGVTQGLASMDAEFSGEHGVFTVSDAKLKSNVYSGDFAGTVDLPRWWIDAEGRVRLEVNLITELLGNRLQMPSLIPISIRGPLDLPNVNMDTGGGSVSTLSQQPEMPARTTPQQTNPVDIFQGILKEIAKPR